MAEKTLTGKLNEPVKVDKVARKNFRNWLRTKLLRLDVQLEALCSEPSALLQYLLEIRGEQGMKGLGFDRTATDFFRHLVTVEYRTGDGEMVTVKPGSKIPAKVAYTVAKVDKNLFSVAYSFVTCFLTASEQVRIREGKVVDIFPVMERAMSVRTFKGATGKRFLSFPEMLAIFAAGKLTKTVTYEQKVKDGELSTIVQHKGIKVLNTDYLKGLSEAELRLCVSKAYAEKREKYPQLPAVPKSL